MRRFTLGMRSCAHSLTNYSLAVRSAAALSDLHVDGVLVINFGSSLCLLCLLDLPHAALGSQSWVGFNGDHGQLLGLEACKHIGLKM